MSNETKLILESLDWIIYNIEPKSGEQSNHKAILLGKINSELNPKVEPTIAEKTHDALSDDLISEENDQ